jgi:hypothetical protein
MVTSQPTVLASGTENGAVERAQRQILCAEIDHERMFEGGAVSSEARPSSAGRGYGAVWRRRRLEHLDRVAARQAEEGWPGGPWCECEVCQAVLGFKLPGGCAVLLRPEAANYAVVAPGGSHPCFILHRADTVDHCRPRRLFSLALQGSDAPGGSDDPSNLRAMSHAHHARRADDKARRRT